MVRLCPKVKGSLGGSGSAIGRPPPNTSAQKS